MDDLTAVDAAEYRAFAKATSDQLAAAYFISGSIHDLAQAIRELPYGLEVSMSNAIGNATNKIARLIEERSS